MTMYRQLLSAIILTSLLALMGSMLASTLGTRAYLVEQLRVKNQDNASALALSLSQTVADPVEAELIVSAQFDNGNYRLVRFSDVFGKVLIEKKSDDLAPGVPAWFIKLLPIEVPAGSAKVSQGWKQLGEVRLESQSAYAYQSFWQSTVRMTLSMVLTAFLACLLGTFILGRMKSPLDLVVEQAKAITEKRFITVPEPRVPELRKLALAMNMTVRKLKAMFEAEASRLEVLRRKANCDELTGLPNRTSFLTQLQEALNNEEIFFGACLILRISNLSGINAEHGRTAVDEIISRVAKVVLATSEEVEGSFAGRLNGADFALFISADQPLEIAEAMVQKVEKDAAEFYQQSSCAAIGMAPYVKGVSLGSLMSTIDIALASSEAEGLNRVHFSDANIDSIYPKTMEAWALLIRNAIKNRLMALLSFPVEDFNGKMLHFEGPLRIRESENSQWIPAGKFIPVAQRLLLNHSIDLAAVELGLRKLKEDKNFVGYAINISASSLNVSVFVPLLKKLVLEYSEEAKRLWIEVPESGAFKYFEEFRNLCMSLEGTFVKVGIEHFGHRFDRIGLLHDLGVDFIKVDASFVRDVDTKTDNQVFLKGLAGIAHEIGMIVIAEGVITKAEMFALKEADFDGVTGQVLK